MKAVRPDVVHIDRALAVLAGSQHGIVTRAQLESLGMTRAQIAHRSRRRALTAVHRGIYAVGHAALSDRARVQAAILIGGGGASDWTAAALLGLAPSMPAVLDVTVPGRAPRNRPTVRFHERQQVEWRQIHGLKVTTPLQTLTDLGFPERLVDEALAKHLVHPRDLQRTPTRSGAERAMERLLRAAGLPQPLINHRLGPYLLDFYWPEQRLAVEIDGRTHEHDAARNRDARRDAYLRDRGVRTERFKPAELAQRPLKVAQHSPASCRPRLTAPCRCATALRRTVRSSPSPSEGR
jgi:very-short-patch-repair endonuclease